MLGQERCLCKPLMCATWMCSYTAQRFKSTRLFLFDIKELFYKARMEYGAWETGVEREVRWKPTNKQQEALRTAISKVRAWCGVTT